MDESLLHKNKKLSAEKEAPEHIESNFYENKLYHIDNTSLEESKEKLEWRKSEFECEQKSTHGIESQNDMTRIYDN